MPPYKCPICNGEGVIFDYEEPGRTTTGSTISRPCHGCGGSGIVWGD